MARHVDGAWVALGVAMLGGGCAQALGIDGEYHVLATGNGGAGDGGTGGSMSATGGSGGMGGTGVVGTLGEPCPEVGVLGCAGNAQKSKLICGPDLKWATNGTCDNGPDGKPTYCDTAVGPDQGTCKTVLPECAGTTAGDVVCDEQKQKRLACGPDLVTIEELETCVDQTCVGGVCVGECAPGQGRCMGNTPQGCDAVGMWQNGTVCTTQTPVCIAGTCTTPPSCSGLAPACGPGGDESCCAITVVPGGSYNRSNDPAYPATVSDFRLDRYEITVGRFRKFVNAYPGSKPAEGAGAHPQIAGSGWDAAWSASLPADQPALKAGLKCSSSFQTWTDQEGANEELPMNCITWYDAFAFCAWDGGRLPTEAEWNYAAAGSGEQREYSWGGAAPDATYAVYGCQGDGSAAGSCSFTDILEVGSKSPKGDGKWGQADLAGGMWEWNLDWFGSYPNQCNDCANLFSGASGRVNRGGCWNCGVSFLVSASRHDSIPAARGSSIGARCARTP